MSYNIKKIPFPKDEYLFEKEPLKCEKCSNELDSKYKWTIQIKYSSMGYAHFIYCKDCIKELFDEPLQRMNFLQELVEFRKREGLNCWEKWNKNQIQEFLDILRNKNIEIRDYGIPIYTEWTHYDHVPRFLHKIIGVIKN